MRKLGFLVLALALWSSTADSQAQWRAIGAAAVKVERSLVAAWKAAAPELAAARSGEAAVAEHAGITTISSSLGGERSSLAAAGAAHGPEDEMGALLQRFALAGKEARLAREAREFGVGRGIDGRFLINFARGPAGLVRSRVATAVEQSPKSVFARAADGRYMSVNISAGDGALARDVSDALTDTVGTALFRELNSERSRGGIIRGSPVGPGELNARVKDLLKSIDHDQVLQAARSDSVSQAAGHAGVSLLEVGDVAVHEEVARPASLLVKLATSPKRQVPLIAHVNLDDVLNRIDKTGF